ncbi:MAG: 50S ribosomal protein L29 [Candidatus Omnitrophica bacterium]|nr:50S ribosomal protein L29 [Candidatus Omnitrophota bacterium]
MKVQELRGLSVDELAEKLNQLKKSLMQYRFQSKTGKLEQQSSIPNVRRDIARVMTLINEQRKSEGAKK